MSVVASSKPPQEELLIREARARQRKRWIVGAAASLAAAGLSLYAALGSTKPSPTRASSSGSRGVVAPSRCETGQLGLRVHPWGVAAGSLLEQLTVTNTSRSSCSVAGWPAVRLRDAAGRTMPSRSFRYVSSESAGPLFHEVTLRPGGAATFNYSAADWNPVANDHRGGACPSARAVQVRLGRGAHWLSAPLRIPACGALFVDPLVPGRTDRSWPAVGIQHFARP